jgi:hypothetical protein
MCAGQWGKAELLCPAKLLLGEGYFTSAGHKIRDRQATGE